MSRPFLDDNWWDFDQASMALVQSLGLCQVPGTTFGNTKWVWWSNNPVGNAVSNLLNVLAEAGLIEKDDDNCRFRWKPGYDPSKFGELCPP